jgi:energy-coupling factor transporter ATP-binding protein EcfA2
VSGQVVAIDGLGVRYPGADEDALSGVSLVIGEGEVVGLVGHAGSGRSTLLRCLDGIVPALVRATVTGRVVVAGRDPTTTPPSAMAGRVAIVLDDPESRISQFSVEEEVAFGLECLGTPLAEMRRGVPAALAAVGLADMAARPPLTLSGGEQQRLAVACAIAVEPALLLLDDPTAHLDPASARAVLGLAVAHARHAGAAVVVATEDVDLLAEVADRVVALDGGRVVADGRPGAVFAEGARTGRWPVPAVAAAWAHARPRDSSLPVTVEQALARTGADRLVRGGSVGAAVERGVAEAPSHPALEVRGVSFRYPDAGRDAVADVSLEIAAGEVVALVGESGSGKSTLARLAAGLLRPRAGTVIAGGADLTTIPRRDIASRVGLVFQNPNHQLLTSTVGEELALGPRNLGVPTPEVERRVDDLARALDLSARLPEHPFRLDMGERKRLTIGAVLAMATPVLVLDEPTSGIDAASRAAVATRIRAAAAAGVAVLLITHDLAFAGQVADRLVVIRDGRVVASGATTAILGDPPGLAAAGLEAPPLDRLRAALDGRAGVPDRDRRTDRDGATA